MYRKIKSGWIKHWDFEILDILFIELAFYLTYFIRHDYQPNEFAWIYKRLGLLIILFDLVVVFFSQNYKDILQRNIGKELIATIKHVSIVELLVLLYEYMIQEAFFMSRTVFFAGWGLAIVFCFLVRIIWKAVVRRTLTSEKRQSKMLMVTTGEHCKNALELVKRKKYREYAVSCIALLDEQDKIEGIDETVDIVSGLDALHEYIRTHVVDQVYIDRFSDEDSLESMIDVFLTMGITVHISMGFIPDDLPNQYVDKIGESPVVTTSIKSAGAGALAIKRLIDILGALVGLVLTGIAFVFVAPAIKKASPGPVFFKQKRVGKNGRTFYIYKFRSMYMDAEERKKELMSQNEMSGLMFKMENDPRIIGSEKGPGKGIGNFIRKTSIDELPQFWNILKGDMSLIGTRPPTVNEYEQYDLHHKIRLSMKPGLTGMWQVSGRSDIKDFEDVVKLDARYIENWSLGMDIVILFKTFKVVLNKEGSR